ncbi:hypothetical protein A7R79_25495 [Pseudomonas aeruginosa]|nr:hypothetical protein A7R79_25495 [Pseudomonas aeruginosa]
MCAGHHSQADEGGVEDSIARQHRCAGHATESGTHIFGRGDRRIPIERRRRRCAGGARQDEVIGEPDVDRYVARAIELNTAAGLAIQRELARVRELHGFPCGLRSVDQPIHEALQRSGRA